MIETARITMAAATRCGNTSPLTATATVILHQPGQPEPTATTS
ncbi:hypothetical protein ACIA8O_00680 [Kitasatospora sp. NPDC051853]